MVDLKEIDERIEKCQKILAQHPESQIFAALSEAYRKKGDLEKAKHICSQGLSIHPNYGSAHLVMAKIDLDQKLYQEAEVELMLAVQVDGMTRTTELLLSQILIQKGQKKEAEAILERLSHIDPDNPAVIKLLKEIGREAKLVKPKKREKDERFLLYPKRKPEEKISASQAVDELWNLPGVAGVWVAAENGLVLESRSEEKEEKDIYGANAVQIFEKASRELPKLNFGELFETWIEGKNFNLWIMKLPKHFLVLKCEKEANIGLLKIRLSKLKNHITLE
jgi:predicted regulator of Ras-like GTPase activity (Roadblock/LC7/MglB family)/thioredoxin-like negative regulator of GroEL